jgi:flagellar FliL protein
MAKSPHPEEAADGGAPAPAKKSILGKLLVLGLVLIVVAVECTVAYFCIPTASATAVAAGNSVKQPPDRKRGETDSEGDSKDDGNVEVDLKEYSVTIFQPASNTTLRIDFHLHGLVDTKDEKEFKDLFDKNLARFREQVSVTVRSAEMADLSDPSLGLIKRIILDKASKIMGNPKLLKEVLITDYSWMEN